jgi:hypothetical protein
MGLLDSYFRLTDLAKASEKRSDVGASLASMQSRLDGLNATMAAQNAQAVAVADPASQARRVEAIATVTSCRLTGAQINQASVVELELLVVLPSGIPLAAAHTAVLSAVDLGRMQSGARVPVSLDPAAPNTTLSLELARTL